MAFRQTLAFGAWLATRGPLARAALGLSALGALAAVAAAVEIARRGGAGAEYLAPIVAKVVSWAVGTSLAFAAAVRALQQDQEEGLVALARARGVGVVGYARGRMGGLSAVIAAAVALPTVIAALAATAVSHGGGATLRSSLGALAYDLVFAAVIGPLALAALGARTRAGGYLTLLAVLVVPELLAPLTSEVLPSGWDELTSIPAALEAVRAGVEAPARHGEAMARAMIGLAAAFALSLAVVAARLRAREEPA